MNLLENFLSQVNNTSTWLTILLDASMKGAVILLAASVLCFFLRRTSAAARHLVWSLALISVLALPVFSMLLPGWNLPVLPKITIIERPTDADKTIDDFFSSYSGNAAPREYQILPNITTMEQQAVETKTFDNLLSTYSGNAALQENQLKSPETVPSSTVNENPNGLTEIQTQISTITPNAISESPSAGLNWSAWLVIIWLIGALSVFARMLIGVIGVHIVKRCAQPVTNTSIVNLSHRIAENLGLKRRFTLLKSSRTRVPLTLGFFKPAVLLPEDAEKWSPSRQKVVLLHELAHIKRSDIVYNVISQAVAALYWFNPLVWYAHHVLYAERERACDDYVIVSGVKSIDYANHLLDIARSLRTEGWISFAPVTMARQSQLEWRMRAILDPKKCRRALKPITTIATCLIVASLVLPFAAMQPVEKEVKINEESTSKTEKINIPLISVTGVEKNLPEGIDAQQQQRNQLIANVIRSLIDSLKSENTDVKMEAVFILGNLIGTSSVYLKDYSLLDALIPLIKDKDAEVRLGALLLVEKFEESETALEALLDAIHDENAKIREGACDFLGDRIRKMSQTETAEIPTIDPRILNALKDALNDEELKVRMTALKYFRYIPESDVLEPLIAALNDKDERVRTDAVEYLSRLQSPEAMDALITAMSDSSAYVQLAIVRALNVIKRGTTRISSRTGINIISDSELDELDLKMLDVIINALQNENYRNRSLAIRIISGIFVAEKSFDALIAAVKDENPEVRMEVLHALGKINDPRVIQILITALKDEDISVRMTAATELGRIRDIRENLPEETAQQQEEPLTALQKEKSENIQKSAVEQSGDIEGYVTDKNTGQPLAGVNIFLNDTISTQKDSLTLSGKTTFKYGEIIKMPVSDLSWLRANQSNITVLTNKPHISKNQRTAVTDEKGYYIIRNVPPGIYSLIAKKEGYFSNVRDSVQIETGKTTRLDFNLTAEVEDIEIQVYWPSGKIDGYVKDKNTGKPLAGVNIFLNDTTYVKKDSIPLSGKTTFTYDEIINMSVSNLRRLLETHSGINVLTNTPYISKNQPLAVTDENGYYIIRNVPPGIYSLIAKKEGYFSNVRDSVQVETGKTTRLDFNLTEGVEDIEIQAYKPSGKIDGYVKDKNTGKPLVGADVSIIGTSLQAVTDKTGYFVIPEISQGTYSISASITGYKKQIHEGIEVREGITSTCNFLLSAVIEDIVIQLSKPSGKIDGYVKDKNSNQPLIGATISINGTSLRAQTDEKGYFVVPNVPHGIYSVSASRIGYLKLNSARLRVTEGMTVTINYRLTALKEVGKIHGYVTDKNTGQPLAGVNIFLNDTTSARKDSIPLSGITTFSYEEITKMPVSDLSKLLATQSNITILKDTLTKKILDRTSRVTTLSYEEIIKMPVSDIRKLLATQSSIHVLTNTPTKKGGYEARGVQEIRMRGGQNEEVALVIDGQVVRNPVFGGFSTPAVQSNIIVRPIAVTDEYGYFVIPNVPPGIYSLTASKTGYKSQTQENVRVTVGVITQLPFEMTVIKEAAESVQDTEHKQEYTATVLLRDSTIKKLDNVDFIIPDRVRMSTEGTTVSGKSVEIFPSESGRKLQKMVILKLETAGGVKLYYSIDTKDKETMVVDLTIVNVKIYYDEGKGVTDARFLYDNNSKIMVKGIDETTQKEWSVELDKIKEIVFTSK